MGGNDAEIPRALPESYCSKSFAGGISRFLPSTGEPWQRYGGGGCSRGQLQRSRGGFPSGWVSLRVGKTHPGPLLPLPEPCYTPQKLPRALRPHTDAISQCQQEPCCGRGAARAASRDKSSNPLGVNSKQWAVWTILIRHQEPPQTARLCFHPQQLPQPPPQSFAPLPSRSPSLEMPLTPSVASLDCTPSCEGSPKAGERG